MNIPDHPISKAVRNPAKAVTWIKNRIIEEQIVTPLRARYLFDHNWEVAIILDACRYDLAVTRGVKHPICLDAPERVYSVASNSADWIRRTFESASANELDRTAYITGNLYTNRLPKGELAYLDCVWKYAWDDQLGCVPPRPLTDRAIKVAREGIADRYIIHYMQPHLPPVRDPPYKVNRTLPREGEGANDLSAWDRVKEGEIDEEVIRSAYRENLDPVLDEVQLLLKNVNASNVVITSDHGNYLGEGGQWGHPNFQMAAPVRHVPWWETEATDGKTYEANEYDRESKTTSREQQLRALGYK